MPVYTPVFCLRIGCHRQAFAKSKLTWLCQVYWKMLYLPKYTQHNWHEYVSDRHWCQGANLAPTQGGWKDHTYQCEECVCLHVCHGEGGDPLSTGGGKVLKCRIEESCRMSSQMWGSWYLPMFLLSDWSLTLMREHWLLDGPSNSLHFPAYNGKAIHIDAISCRLTMLVIGEGGPWDVP